VLRRVARLTTRRPRFVLAVAGIVVLGCALLGLHASSKLLPAGFASPTAPSEQAKTLLDRNFAGGSSNLILLVTAKNGSVDSPAVATAGRQLTQLVAGNKWISRASSYWTTGNPALRSRTGGEALILANVEGTDAQLKSHTTSVLNAITSSPVASSGVITVKAGGAAGTNYAVSKQISKDLALSEGIAIPLTALLLVFAFGSVVAALLPVAIGLIAIVATLAVLFLLGSVTDVSVYALNLTTAMGLGLAIDYGLLMVNRYREEPASGGNVSLAVERAVATAGRTILFSSATVAAAMAALLVFPVYFLRSFAYAGVSVVIVAAAGALFVLPALLMVVGERINRLSVRRRPANPVSAFWNATAQGVMRRPLAAGGAIIALLVVLALPFFHVHFGSPDDRVLPTSSPARQVGDALRSNFALNAGDTVEVVTEAPVAAPQAAAYSAELSRLSGVLRVSGPAGTWAGGDQVSSAGGPRYTSDSGDWFSATVSPDPLSAGAATLVGEVRATTPPGGVAAVVGGQAASLADQKHDLRSGLPLAIILIAITTFVVLFLYTGSVVLPLKALALNTLSLGAVLGVAVWIFQQGHLSGLLGFTPTSMSTTMPLLLFCIAFGLSMDYEVFLLSRIKELHERGEANEASVAGGLARSGRIVTTAAALLCVTFFAFGLSKVSFIQMFGIGTGFAILLDATLVRGVLVPAFMRVAGEWNWWAPRPLRWLHQRIGFTENVAGLAVEAGRV
jgi:RND superfamily putative drug exporter